MLAGPGSLSDDHPCGFLAACWKKFGNLAPNLDQTHIVGVKGSYLVLPTHFMSSLCMLGWLLWCANRSCGTILVKIASHGGCWEVGTLSPNISQQSLWFWCCWLVYIFMLMIIKIQYKWNLTVQRQRSLWICYYIIYLIKCSAEVVVESLELCLCKQIQAKTDDAMVAVDWCHSQNRSPELARPRLMKMFVSAVAVWFLPKCCTRRICWAFLYNEDLTAWAQ